MYSICIYIYIYAASQSRGSSAFISDVGPPQVVHAPLFDAALVVLRSLSWLAVCYLRRKAATEVHT